MTFRRACIRFRLALILFSQIFTYSGMTGSIGRELRRDERQFDAFVRRTDPTYEFHQRSSNDNKTKDISNQNTTETVSKISFANHRMEENTTASIQDQMQSGSVNRPQISLNIYSNGLPANLKQISSNANQNAITQQQQLSNNLAQSQDQNLGGYDLNAKSFVRSPQGSFFILPLLTSQTLNQNSNQEAQQGRRLQVSPSTNSKTLNELNGLHYLTDSGSQIASDMEDAQQGGNSVSLQEDSETRSKPLLKAIIKVPSDKFGRKNESVSSGSDKNFQLNMSLNGDEIIISPSTSSDLSSNSTDDHQPLSSTRGSNGSAKGWKRKGNNKKHLTFESSDDQQSASEIMPVDHSKSDGEDEDDNINGSDNDSDGSDNVSQSESRQLKPLASGRIKSVHATSAPDSEDDGEFDKSDGSEGDEDDGSEDGGLPLSERSSRKSHRLASQIQDDGSIRGRSGEDGSPSQGIRSSKRKQARWMSQHGQTESQEQPKRTKLAKRGEKIASGNHEPDSEASSSIVLRGEDLRKFKQILDGLRSLSLDNLGKPSSSSSKRATSVLSEDEVSDHQRPVRKSDNTFEIARSQQQMRPSVDRENVNHRRPKQSERDSLKKTETADCNQQASRGEEQYEFEGPIRSGSSNHATRGLLEGSGDSDLDHNGNRLEEPQTDIDARSIGTSESSTQSTSDLTGRREQNLDQLMQVEQETSFPAGSEQHLEGNYPPEVIYSDQLKPAYTKKMVIQDFYENEKSPFKLSRGAEVGQATSLIRREHSNDQNVYHHQRNDRHQLATASSRQNSVQKISDSPLTSMNNYIDYNQLDNREVYRAKASVPDVGLKPQSRSFQPDQSSKEPAGSLERALKRTLK